MTDLLSVAVVGSGASAGPYGIVSNTNGAFYFTTGREWPGFVTDGFGSGGSPAPYAIDPFNAISARGREEDRPVVVDGYFSEYVFPSFLPATLLLTICSQQPSRGSRQCPGRPDLRQHLLPRQQACHRRRCRRLCFCRGHGGLRPRGPQGEYLFLPFRQLVFSQLLFS